MTSRRLFFIFVAFLFAWLGCDKHTDPIIEQPPTDFILIPMRVGASWTTTVTQYDSNGAVFGTVTSGTFTIVYSELFGSDRWYTFGFGSDLLPRKNNYNGMWTRWSDSTVRLEFTITLGDSCLTARNGSYVKLIDLDSVITVPAGTFTCYRYRELFPSTPYEEWDYFIAPGVGIVRHDLYVSYNNGKQFMQAQSVLTSRTP